MKGSNCIGNEITEFDERGRPGSKNESRFGKSMSILEDILVARAKKKFKKEYGKALANTCGMSDDDIDDFFDNSFAEAKREQKVEQARKQREAKEELENRHCCANCNYFMSVEWRTDSIEYVCRYHDIEYTRDQINDDYHYTHGCRDFLRR